MDPEIETKVEENQPDPDLTGLKNKNAQLLADNTRYKNALKAHGGIDAVLQRLADLEAQEQEAEANKESEAVKANNLEALKASHDKKVAELQKANEALQQRLVRTHLDKLIADAVAAERGSAKLLGPHLATAITGALDKDGEIQVSVKGLDGTQLETVTDLVKQLKVDPAFGAAFDADDTSGAGVRASNGKVNGNPFAVATEDVPEQMKLINNEPAKAKQLALQAGWDKNRIMWA